MSDASSEVFPVVAVHERVVDVYERVKAVCKRFAKIRPINAVCQAVEDLSDTVGPLYALRMKGVGDPVIDNLYRLVQPFGNDLSEVVPFAVLPRLFEPFNPVGNTFGKVDRKLFILDGVFVCAAACIFVFVLFALSGQLVKAVELVIPLFLFLCCSACGVCVFVRAFNGCGIRLLAAQQRKELIEVCYCGGDKINEAGNYRLHSGYDIAERNSDITAQLLRAVLDPAHDGIELRRKAAELC